MKTKTPQPYTVMSAKEIMAIKTPVLVKETKTTIKLVTPFGNYYEIERSRANTPEKLLGWIAHLSEKTWVTPEHIRQLILILGKIKGMSIEMKS